MAVQYSQMIRIGAGNPIVEEVGGDFLSPLLDLGETHPEGITVTLGGNDKKIGSAQSTLHSDILPAAAREVTVKFRVKAQSVEALALAMGQGLDVVADDEAASPVQRYLEVADYAPPVYYALRIKCPQTDDPDLYDIWTFYKGRFITSFEQALTYDNERYIPLEFCGVRNDDGKAFRIGVEGEEGDLP